MQTFRWTIFCSWLRSDGLRHLSPLLLIIFQEAVVLRFSALPLPVNVEDSMVLHQEGQSVIFIHNSVRQPDNFRRIETIDSNVKVLVTWGRSFSYIALWGEVEGQWERRTRDPGANPTLEEKPHFQQSHTHLLTLAEPSQPSLPEDLNTLPLGSEFPECGFRDEY